MFSFTPDSFLRQLNQLHPIYSQRKAKARTNDAGKRKYIPYFLPEIMNFPRLLS